MNSTIREKALLEQSRKAEELASKAVLPSIREQWLSIAASYRALIKLVARD